VIEILERAKKAEITPPRQLDPTIPGPVEAVCLKALAAAPENRYTTPREFAAALRQALEPTAVATPPPARLPARLRRALPAAVLACGLPALAAWLWPRGSETAVPLQADITVKLFKELGDGRTVVPRGTISQTSLASNPPRLKDMVRIEVTLSRPAYSNLIALDPDGKVELCGPAGVTASGAPRRELVFPEDPKYYFSLTDGVGLQAFVVVASDRPLPAYETWKTQVPGGLAWSPVDQEGLWTYDSAAPSDAARRRGQLRGEILRRESAPEALLNLCDRLRRSPGVTLVRAVAFPVKPEEGILK
jgi:hypothetical protein